MSDHEGAEARAGAGATLKRLVMACSTRSWIKPWSLFSIALSSWGTIFVVAHDQSAPRPRKIRMEITSKIILVSEGILALRRNIIFSDSMSGEPAWLDQTNQEQQLASDTPHEGC